MPFTEKMKIINECSFSLKNEFLELFPDLTVSNGFERSVEEIISLSFRWLKDRPSGCHRRKKDEI